MKAYQDNLDEISEDELPRDLKPAFAKLKARMCRVTPLNGEGPIRASVRKMSINEASECAVSVLGLYGDIVRNGGTRQDPLPLGNEPEKVPPFLVKSVS